jgi:hypothetical protein
VLDRVRRRAWGLSGRLIASYILVTLAVVVLIEALVFGFEVPQLLCGSQVQTQLQAQVDATAKSYAQQLSQHGSGGVPAGTVLGDPGQPAQPGEARTASDGTLVVPAITRPVKERPSGHRSRGGLRRRHGRRVLRTISVSARADGG